jgi:hypothetical protein
MSTLDELDKPLIEPIYSQAGPNQPIVLGATEVQFTYKGETYRGTATVTSRFVPNERLCFVVPIILPKLCGANDWDRKLTLADRGITLDVLCVSAPSRSEGGRESGELVFVPGMSPVIVTLPSEAISSAVFHLFNLPYLFGPEDYSLTQREPRSEKHTRCGRVNLKADGWDITIAATGKTSDLCEALKNQGGFVITHMGRIEREDGSTFSSRHLEDLLRCVHYFLSFALGRWAGVAFPIGLNKTGRRVHEEWGLPLVAAGPWNGSYSWFEKMHGELLSQVFPGFMALWNKELWRGPLKDALWWYLGACERDTGIGVDTGLILAQTALELLAWNYCVRERKMVSEEAFGLRGLSAADRLRILASSLGIPLEIPACLRALGARRGRKWQDGMEAITSIRNACVHPRAENSFPDHSYFEGWKLSLWYIDMVLLRLCGHIGQYSNRLIHDRWAELETVPWAMNKAEKEDQQSLG